LRTNLPSRAKKGLSQARHVTSRSAVSGPASCLTTSYRALQFGQVNDVLSVAMTDLTLRFILWAVGTVPDINPQGHSNVAVIETLKAPPPQGLLMRARSALGRPYPIDGTDANPELSRDAP